MPNLLTLRWRLPLQWLKRKKRLAKPGRDPRFVFDTVAYIALHAHRQAVLQKVTPLRNELSNRLQIHFNPDNWSDNDCERLIRDQGSNWRKVQAVFKDDPDAMTRLVKFRKSFVDKLINEIAKDPAFPGLVATAGGSTDLSSDYDVTIGTTARGDADARAIRALNARIKQAFGKQPATVFDTNFYLCDFLPLSNNIVTRKNSLGQDELVRVHNATGPESPITVSHQDVLALIKQRRYMDQAEWNDYVDSVVQAIPNEAARQLEREQYEEADRIFHANVRELLDQTNDPVHSDGMTDEQKLRLLDETAPDRVRAKADELYTQVNLELRRLQQQLVDETDPDEITALRTQIETETGRAAFFASEAYHTRGAIQHIVRSRQDNDPAVQAEILHALTVPELLDSMNEQLGDFLKDMRHYKSDEPGLAYYRASKYLSRLLEASILLGHKDGRATGLDFEANHRSLQQMKEWIDAVLLPARKTGLDVAPAERIAACEDLMVGLLGVTSIEDLKGMVLDLTTEINGKLRGPLPAAGPIS